MIQVDGGDVPGTPGSQFQANTSGARKEIQAFAGFKVELIIQDVEQSGFGKISCRANRKIAGRANEPAFVFSAYDAQITWLKRLKCKGSGNSLKLSEYS